MRTQLLVHAFGFACGAALACSAVAAQVPTAPAPAASAPEPAHVNGRTTFQADDGTIVTVRSYQPAHTDVRPPPAFATLDTDGNGSISAREADAYPLLANDFLHADSSHNKAVSQSEYSRWVTTP